MYIYIYICICLSLSLSLSFALSLTLFDGVTRRLPQAARHKETSRRVRVRSYLTESMC